MARGNFRTGRFDCLYCGNHGLTVPRGKANNPMFLCLRCAERFDEALAAHRLGDRTVIPEANDTK